MSRDELRQEATRVRRKAMWLADDYLRLTGDLEGFRKIIRLRRRFIWYCGFWRHVPLQKYARALKEIYGAATIELFQKQTTLYDYFTGAHYDGQTGIRVSKSERSDANRDLATDQQAVEENR